MSDWKRHFGDTIAGAARLLSPRPGELAKTVPCPKSGQRLAVAERNGKYFAFPEDGFEFDGLEISLSREDVALWYLDRSKLHAALCACLDLVPVESLEQSAADCVLIGKLGFGEASKSVYLGYPKDVDHALNLCVSVAAQNRQRCSLILPAYDRRCEEYLRRCEHDYITLEATLDLRPDGIARRSPGTPTPDSALITVALIGDYKGIQLPDGTLIDLAKRPKCRAFVRHVHKRRQATGEREFVYETEVENLNNTLKLDLRAEFKYGLFRGMYEHFDILFTTLDSALGRYRINF